MNAYSADELEAAAREVREYIISKRAGKPMNSSHDFDIFRRTFTKFNSVWVNIKPKPMCERFPNIIRWEAKVAPGINHIHAVSNGNVAQSTQSAPLPSPPTANTAPVAKPASSIAGVATWATKAAAGVTPPPPRAIEDTLKSVFTCNDDDLHPNILQFRDKLIEDGWPEKQGCSVQEFKWGYDILARHTMRLAGVLATSPNSVNYIAMRDIILALLDEHPEEEMREELSQVEVHTFLFKNPTHCPEALCYFTLVHLCSTEITDSLFNFLVEEAIPNKRLRLGGVVVTIDYSKGTCPWKPHQESINCIPDMVKERRTQARKRLAAMAKPLSSSRLAPSPGKPDAASSPANTSSNDLVAAGSSFSVGTAFSGLSMMTAPPPGISPPPPTPSAEDLANLIPAPYGHLEHGLASPVINPVRLMMLSQERYMLFEQLKMAVADTSSDKSKTAWFFETTDQGSFVCYKHSRFLLGSGSEAKVYLGGFLEGLHGSDERDVIRQHFTLYARPVAIKQFHTKESQLESSTVRVLPRGVDGILTYLASFEAHDELYTVQELGLVSLSDRIIAEATFDERLTMIRGACLAIRELHRRSGGAIVHRDIRMGNFMLTDNGRIKTCDFGISRVLPDAKKTVLAFGNALSPLACQPYEVQVAITQLINQREQAAKTQSFSTMSFLSEDQDYLPVSTSADIFMLGLVLYKLVTKVDAMSHSDILQKKIPDFSLVTKLFSGGHLLAHLLSCMLSHEATKRPSIDQVLEHPFFRSWQENETVIQTLYRELHDGDGYGQGVRYTESFRILESVLQPFEQHVSWPTCLQALPAHVRSQMSINQMAPVIILPDGLGSKPHPLPNIHQAICWLRYFYAHFREQKVLAWIWMDLRSGIREKEYLGEFIHAHPSISWILPKLWETKVHFLQQIQVERDAWEKEWENKQRHNEDMHNRFRTHERKVKALI